MQDFRRDNCDAVDLLTRHIVAYLRNPVITGVSCWLLIFDFFRTNIFIKRVHLSVYKAHIDFSTYADRRRLL